MSLAKIKKNRFDWNNCVWNESTKSVNMVSKSLSSLTGCQSTANWRRRKLSCSIQPHAITHVCVLWSVCIVSLHDTRFFKWPMRMRGNQFQCVFWSIIYKRKECNRFVNERKGKRCEIHHAISPCKRWRARARDGEMKHMMHASVCVAWENMYSYIVCEITSKNPLLFKRRQKLYTIAFVYFRSVFRFFFSLFISLSLQIIERQRFVMQKDWINCHRHENTVYRFQK